MENGESTSNVSSAASSTAISAASSTAISAASSTATSPTCSTTEYLNYRIPRGCRIILCAYPDCYGPPKKNGFCKDHGPRCSIEGCVNPQYKQDRCSKHQPPPLCLFPSCAKPGNIKSGLCSDHTGDGLGYTGVRCKSDTKYGQCGYAANPGTEYCSDHKMDL
jgi:hypothetical protein